MATRLKSVSEMTKKGAVFFGIAVVIFLVLRVMFQTAVRVLTPPPPTPSPYINPEFGVLPKLSFPDTVSTSQGKSINLETVSGTIQESTGSAVVYEINQAPVPDLEFGLKAKQLATNYGINNVDPLKTNDNHYIFQDPLDTNKQLDIDYVYFNYKLNYQNPASYIAIEKGNTPSIDNAKNQTLQYLGQTRKDITVDEIQTVRNPSLAGVYNLFDPITQQTSLVQTQQTANITNINFYRKPISGTPIVGPSTTRSLINFAFTGITASGQSQTQIRVLEANVIYWTINPSGSAVYLVRTANEAFTDLTQGRGYILNETSPGDEYLVRKSYLAYYEPPTIQKYLLPIWVFEGDKRSDANFTFRAVVPAVAKGYIEE
jgi:hypothetical protein